jgi:hypothetical protein
MEEVDLFSLDMAFPRLLFWPQPISFVAQQFFAHSWALRALRHHRLAVGLIRTSAAAVGNLGKLWLFGPLDIQTTIHMYTQHQYSIYI